MGFAGVAPTPEHVLLALMWEGTGAVTVLTKLKVRDELEARLRSLMSEATYSPDKNHMNQVMTYASSYLGGQAVSERVGTKHVLAGMTQLTTGVVAQVFDEMQLRPRLRRALAAWLHTS